MKSIRFLLLAALSMLALQLPGAVLVDRAAPNWRWRPGTNEASNPIGSWRVSGFNDSEFTTAPAPFWYDVTGDTSTLVGGTQIPQMQNNYTSIFLRVTFVLTNTSEIAFLKLGALIDDGFVAWINGTEVQRVNMPGVPGDPVYTSILAVNATEPIAFTTYTLTSPPNYLVIGTNVLAVEGFQSALASSDFDFDASLESTLVETNPPTVLGANPPPGGTVNGLATITVTFSEPVFGVDAADLLINGTPSSTVTPVNSSVYTFAFTQPAYGTVQITWNVSHGITDQAIPPNPFNATGPGATWQYNLVDTTAPAVATLSPAANSTVTSLTNITVVFSEPVAGVNASDLRINNNPATGLLGGGNNFTFTFPQPATGLVQVAWAAGHGITDLATVPNAFVAGSGWLYTLNPNASQTGGPVISEFMALNTGALLDENGDASDWIEIQNTGSFTVNLLNWSLTDDAGNLMKWQFPSTNLASGGFILVFASEKNRRVPGAQLHTNFKLDGSGEYLALVRPDGSVASAFAPAYPQQAVNVSYGMGVLSSNSTLVSTSALARIRIPSSGAEGTNWLYVGFDDSGWIAGTNGVGYGATNGITADYSQAVLPTAPILYWRMNELNGTTAANIGSMGTSGNGTYQSSPALGVAGPRPSQFNGFEANNTAVQLLGTAGGDFVAGPVGLLSGRAAFSLSGWIRPTGPQAARTGLFGQNDSVEFGFISAGTIQVWTPSGNIAAYTYPYPDNEWHHLAVVGSSAQLFLYVDGTQRATSAGAAAVSSFGFNAGGGGVFDATGNDFVGQMDEIAVWDRALTPAEVLGLFSAGTNPVGVAAVKFAKTDVGPTMSNINASAYVRLPFTITDPSTVQLLSLRVRYDDGFVAYINGIEVARANAPGVPFYNSTATNTHSAATVDLFQLGSAVLRPGANMLAIQGLNAAANDDDFLIGAELTATHNAGTSDSAVYMTTPSPGAPNAAGVPVLGPAIKDPTHSPNVPTDNQNIVVTVKVAPTFASIGSVAVRYQVMYGTINELAMVDDGTQGDAVAGDGVYSQTLPIAAVSTNGQMIRWYFRATDSLGRVSRWPLFLAPVDEEFLGTIVDPAGVTSQLPIYHLFAASGVVQTPRITPVTTQTGADGEGGGRISIFYDGEFYDNVYMELRGNTSAGQNKKSHRLEFNKEHKFRHLPGYPRVRKTSFMAEFLDPAYIRQHLSFWLLDQMGEKTPFFYPVRAQLNASFYGLVFHSDVIDLEQVERMGFDPNGALYKAAGNCLPSESSTGVFQKKSDPLNDHTDYQTFVRAINETNTVAGRRGAAYDMMDIPEIINYLAGARWTAENDDVWANMSLYRDTYGDQLWRIIPFDMNASWGQRYGGISPLDAIADTCKSHPLYGCSTIIACDGSTYNRVYDTVVALPELREMILRRQRTVLDRWVLQPGIDPQSRLLESHIRDMTNAIWNEAFLDRASWGYSTWTASNKPLTNAINELFNEFINLRRTHWSVTHNITNVAKAVGTTPTSNAGIPQSQPAHPPIVVGAIDFNPSSGNQLQEYITFTNPNPYAVDISGWKVSGGVQFTFKPGTVLPSNGVLYASPNIPAFRQRTVGPRGGQGLFVVGPYSGQLNARGESIVLKDDTGFLITSNQFVGTPSPAQLYLRITEIMYNPAPLAGNTNDSQAFEYVELKNISGSTTLDLNGVKLIEGVEFAFTNSAITSLAPGARALLVRSTNAFTARYGAGRPVAGVFSNALDNAGERIQLLDGSNEEILDFSYNNTWYPATDGNGFSLVVVDELAEPDSWSSKTNWRPSGVISGSPGVVDPAPPVLAPVVINELLTHSIGGSAIDAVELFNPSASPANIGGWFLSDDFTNVFKYRFANGTTIPAGGYLVVDESQFNNPANALVPFAFSSSGDEVRLASGDINTNLTGYMTGENFGAAKQDVSFGRYTNSQGSVRFVAQAANSFNAPNGLPRVGPLVVSEIMYHPPDITTFLGTTDNDIDEYIEIENITGSPQKLFDPNAPTNTWRLREAVSFTFPQNVTIPPNGHVVVVSFDPSDAAAASAFRFRNGASSLTPLFGPWDGQLDNSSDSVELAAPNPPTTNGVAYYLVDKVHYEQSAGWTNGADGTGLALQRINASAYGDDPINWTASGRTPGFDASSTNGPVISSQPHNTSVLRSLTAMFSVTASGAAPIVYQWRFNTAPIAGATNSLLVLPNVQFSQAGTYSCLLENPAGVVVSANATLTVITPADITTHPTNIEVRVRPDGSTDVAPSTNAAFTVVASTMNPPLAYQWRINGTNLSASTKYGGPTGTTLTVSNVTIADYADYSCAVTDGAGTIFSSNATLYPLVRPTILINPATQTVPAFGAVPASVVLSNGFPPPFRYIWYRASNPFATNISDSKTNFMVIPGGIVGNASSAYTVRLTNRALLAPAGANSASFTLTIEPDTDLDGMPDSFEQTYSGSATGLAPGGDADGDGMTNLAEYLAGTDPSNPNSYLRINQNIIAGTASVNFAAVSNRTYTVQYSDILPAVTWQRLADIVSRPSNRVEVLVDPGWTTNRFYRAVTPRQP